MRGEITIKQLESVASIRRRIARDEEELKAMEEELPCDLQAMKLSHNPSHSNFPKGIDDALAKYIDAKARYERRLYDNKRYLVEMLTLIDEFISTLDDPLDQEVVNLRCKETLTFEEIAADIHRSRSTVQRIYYRATKSLAHEK